MRGLQALPQGPHGCKNVSLQVVVLLVGFVDEILCVNKHSPLMVLDIVLAFDILFLAESILSVLVELVLNFGIFEPLEVDFVEVLKVVVVHIAVVMVPQSQMVIPRAVAL